MMFSLGYLFLRNQDGILLPNIMSQTFYTLHVYELTFFLLFCYMNCVTMRVMSKFSN